MPETDTSFSKARAHIEKFSEAATKAGAVDKVLFSQSLYLNATGSTDGGQCHGFAVGYLISLSQGQSAQFLQSALVQAARAKSSENIKEF